MQKYEILKYSAARRPHHPSYTQQHFTTALGYIKVKTITYRAIKTTGTLIVNIGCHRAMRYRCGKLFSGECFCLSAPNDSWLQILFFQCWGSVTFWCRSASGSGSMDPHLWLMDPDPVPDPDPTPDPDRTPFFSDFKDAKINFFPDFFLITYPQPHYILS